MKVLRRILVLATALVLPPPGRADSGGTPSPQIDVRNAHAIAYDSDRGRVVLFGGANASKVRGDTWEWDGRRWSPVSQAGPGPRTFPAMTYDSVRKKVVPFGGNRVLFGRTPEENRFLDDTWEWDGRRWAQIPAAGPAPRAEAAMAFDGRPGRVVLFGGYNGVGEARRRLEDTWEWDGDKWVQKERGKTRMRIENGH